jgi:ribokinase
MNERPQICVVGSTNTDLISYVERMPRVGETIRGRRFQMGYGGKGANQAVMAAKLGAQVTIITRVGKDVFGEGSLKNFAEAGIDIRYVGVEEDVSTGVAPIAVDAAGQNAIIVVGGANERLLPAHVEAAREAIARARVLVCQLEVPTETTHAALALARSLGVTTILNPAPAPQSLDDALIALSDVFCPNESETELLTGMSTATLDEAEAAGRRLLARGAGAVVLTLGARGALLVQAEEVVQMPAPQVTPLDTTGAGDAFVGSMAFFLASGLPLRVAIERANQLAALSVQSAGTQTSFPTRAQLPAELFL